MRKALSVAIVLASVLLMSAAQAMQIRQFDKMAIPDQPEYVGLLVGGAEQVLKDEGRADLAATVEQFLRPRSQAITSPSARRNLKEI